MITGLDEKLAKAHNIPTALYEYIYVGLLALIVIVAVRATGVLLVTALLIIPSAAARNLASGAGKMVFFALLFGLVSGIAGLLLSEAENLAIRHNMENIQTILFKSCKKGEIMDRFTKITNPKT